VGQCFFSQDSPGDIGIYRVREWKKGDGSRTHLYFYSVSTVTEAIEKCNELNKGSETLDTKCDK
jgi:hypothetical protein